jgi:hypothetical protein
MLAVRKSAPIQRIALLRDMPLMDWHAALSDLCSFLRDQLMMKLAFSGMKVLPVLT